MTKKELVGKLIREAIVDHCGETIPKHPVTYYINQIDRIYNTEPCPELRQEVHLCETCTLAGQGHCPYYAISIVSSSTKGVVLNKKGEVLKCPDCQQEELCPHCGGEGYHDSLPAPMFGERVKCAYCNGTGRK